MNYKLSYWIALVLQTRSFGHCYVHSGARKAGAPEHEGIKFSYCGWGRSLQSGGHKYKAHAYRDGKPVSTKELKELREQHQ